MISSGMTCKYLGIAERQGAEYVVRFPDMPKVELVGEDLGDLVRQATNVLQARIGAMFRAGENVPLPSAMPTINAEGIIPLSIKVTLPFTPVEIGVLLAPSTLGAIDERSSDRAHFIRQAVEQALDKPQTKQPIFAWAAAEAC